jgi:hypothetical protein
MICLIFFLQLVYFLRVEKIMNAYKISFAVLLLSFVWFHPVQAAMCDYDKDGTTDSGWSVVKGVCVPAPSAAGGLSNTPVNTLLGNLVSWLIGFAGLMVIVGFLTSAFFYFTAAGDEEKAKLAKKAFWYSLIGTFIALGGVVFVNIISNFIGGGAI